MPRSKGGNSWTTFEKRPYPPKKDVAFTFLDVEFFVHNLCYLHKTEHRFLNNPPKEAILKLLNNIYFFEMSREKRKNVDKMLHKKTAF